MQSIASLRASNGAANASVVTVQSLRSPGATTIAGNTVTGLPPFFIATMGAPHTFTDPVTGETITVISEATAVDFAGHVNGSNLIIDTIAPGYADTRGSLVGDIVVLRPTTFYADTLANTLAQSHNDDGSFKADSIVSEVPFADAVDPVLRMTEMFFDFVVPGGAILAGLGYGSTLTASLSSGVCYINGYRQLIAAVATRTYTASKDTYVDALYNASGTATIVYTEVATDAASPALAANSIRLGIVVSAANIASLASINQGQENKLVPQVTATEFMTVTDSLGNLICPRDPLRRTLGYRQITSNRTTSSATQVQITGLRVPIKVPLGRKIRIEFFSRGGFNATSGANYEQTLWEGTVVSGTKLQGAYGILVSAGASTGTCFVEYTPTSANITINAGFQASTGVGTIDAATDAPAHIRISLV